MIKLVCTECKSEWYTANTSWTGCCETCGGKLEEDEDFLFQGKKSSPASITEKEIASSRENSN